MEHITITLGNDAEYDRAVHGHLNLQIDDVTRLANHLDQALYGTPSKGVG